MIKAVIFDMYETLITLFDSPLYFGTQMAADAGIPEEKFQKIWRAEEKNRTIGKITLEELLEKVLRENNCFSEEKINYILKKRIHCKEEAFQHLHIEISVVYKIGDISLTHSGIFFWLNSNAVMSKKRFWLFMTLPLLVLTIIPMIFLLLTDGFGFELLRYILCVNAIIAGSDIINSILIAVKPSNVKFCGGYYIDSRNT